MIPIGVGALAAHRLVLSSGADRLLIPLIITLLGAIPLLRPQHAELSPSDGADGLLNLHLDLVLLIVDHA